MSVNQLLKIKMKGKVCIVTGANSGIGRAIALEMAREGASVVINWLFKEEETQAMLDEIQDVGGTATCFQADVRVVLDVLDLFAFAKETYGTVDILVNNAGIQKDSPFTEMTVADWDKVMDVSLKGQFLCAREAVKEFISRGIVEEVSCAAGKIICMSSVHEVIPWAGHVNYAASMGGVMMMMQSIAQEVAPHKIRVNSIGP